MLCHEKQVPLDFLADFDFFIETSTGRSEMLENHRGIIFRTPLGHFWGVKKSSGITQHTSLLIGCRFQRSLNKVVFTKSPLDLKPRLKPKSVLSMEPLCTNLWFYIYIDHSKCHSFSRSLVTEDSNK